MWIKMSIVEICKGTCRNGKACIYKAKCDGYCKLHHKPKTECSICLEETNDCVNLACRHTFHVGCIKEWITRGNRTCPVCRGAITIKTLNSIGITPDMRAEAIREAELFITGALNDNLSLKERYIQCFYIIKTVLYTEVTLRENIIKFLKVRVRTKKGEKECEALEREIKLICKLMVNANTTINDVTNETAKLLTTMVMNVERLFGWVRVA